MPDLESYRAIEKNKPFSASRNILVNAAGAKTLLVHITSLTGAGAGVFEGTYEDAKGLGESAVDWFPLPSVTVNSSTPVPRLAGATVTPTDDDLIAAATLGSRYVRFRRTANSGVANTALSDDSLANIVSGATGTTAVTVTPPAIQCTSFIADGTDELLIDATARKFYGVTIFTIDATPVYVKAYDKATAASESDTPIHRTGVPANGTAANGAGSNQGPWPVYIPLTNGLSIRAVTGIADNNDSALTTAENLVNVYWSA